MRDRINIYHQREILNIPCISCASPRHQIQRCPIINYIPNRDTIINVFRKECFQHRKLHQRRSKKSSAYMMKPKLIDYSNNLKLKYPEFFENFFPDEEMDSQIQSDSADSEEIDKNSVSLESPPMSPMLPENKRERKSSSERIDLTNLPKNEKGRSLKKRSLMNNKSMKNFPKLHTKIYEGGQDSLINFEIGRNYKIYFPNNNLSEIIRLDHLRHQCLSSSKITKNKANKSKERIKIKGILNSNDSMNQISNDAIGSSYTFRNFKVKEFKLSLEKIKAKTKDNF